MARIALAAASIALLSLSALTAAHAQVGATIVIQSGSPHYQRPAPALVQYQAPPPPRYEAVPRHRRGMAWVPGHWEWRGHRHVWMQGHWVKARPATTTASRAGWSTTAAGPCSAAAGTVTATAWPTATTGTATVTAYPTAATASPTTPAATDCNRAQLSANKRYVSRIGTTGCRRGGFSAQLKLGAAQAREVGHHHRARRHQHGTGA